MTFDENMVWIVCIFVPLLLTIDSVGSQSTKLSLWKFQHYSGSITWKQAQSTCREQHDDLLTIRNKQEVQAVSGGRGWIGLFRESNDAPWKWSKGDDEATFFNWGAGEPQDGENCVFQDTNTGKWINDKCNAGHTYMCYDEALVLVKQNKTWEEALEYCRSLKEPNSYDMVTLITPDDHNYARQRAQDATTDEVWTGLRFLGDGWFWVDGEAMQYQDIPSCPATRCGALGKNSSSLFEVRNCSQRRNFFCYKKPADP